MAITVRELADAALAARLIAKERLLALPGRDRLGVPEFVDAVTSSGRFPPAALYRAVAEARGIAYVDCDAFEAALDLVRLLPRVLLRRGLVLPVSR